MADQIVVDAGKVERIKSRVVALQDEIARTTSVVRGSEFARSSGAGARSLTAMGVAVAHAGDSLGRCASKCACLLQEALDQYVLADEDAARRIR